ncbi:MAG: hypothetical protein U0441_22510 [Polyangiaceae bacterium]
MDALRAFEAVDFQSAQNLDTVWQDPRYDVPALHQKERQAVLARVRAMAESPETGSPLGWVLVGPAGIGKTHLLSAIRRDVLAVPASFVLVDLIDVRDFWETVLLGFIDALQRPAGSSDRTQGQLLVQHIAAQARGDDGAAMLDQLASLRPPRLALVMDELVQRLGRTHRAQTLKHADALRALVLLNSNEMELSNLGYAWLQGYGVDESAMGMFGFNIREKKPSAVVEGLSWLMSLRCPMVVAVDHMDAIVAEHHALAAPVELPEEHAARQMVSRSILDGISRGLMELRDVTRRTLTVVSCLQQTWGNLQSIALKSATHRYEDQRPLSSLPDAAMAEHIVGARLDAGYSRVSFEPPYPRWPFLPSAFASIAEGGKTPRELLRRCEQHRRKCVDQGRVEELPSFINDEPSRAPVAAPAGRELEAFDAELQRLRTSIALPKPVPEPDNEAAIGKLLLTGCELVIAEHPDEPDVQISIDAESGIQRGYPALHARVRQIFTAQNDRERHLCLRALWKDNPIAFQARLTAALTASGIDRQIEFRKLLLVRNTPVPSGAKTNALMTKARSAGAEMISASEEDLRILAALANMRAAQGEKRDTFEQWLRARQPASRLAVMKPLMDWLGRKLQPAAPNEAPQATKPVPPGATAPPVKSSASGQAGSKPSSGAPAKPARAVLAIGHQLIGEKRVGPQTILAEDLRQHVVVLAGAGSGKTVLLRRLIEESALLGIPSIVVDGANDLARLGEAWPARPEGFTDEDQEKASRYHAQTDVVVWTPGRANGNPLHLSLLPDFSAVAQDHDELEQTISMTASALASIGVKRPDDKARAILESALRLFAQQGGGDLDAFLDLLSDLPEEAGLKISTARRISTGLCDSLRAARQTNPLLRQGGEPLDPGILFGVGSGLPRVSVLSLVGLPGLDASLQFVNQLAMSLFTWVKKNPCPADRPLRGLLIIDEAKDFVPSQTSTPCKESLIRLAAQGRKYGLGVVFASQAPKSIDHNIIANASTQLYGKASSPAAIDAVEGQLRQLGATKVDVARLPRGRFYLASKGMPAPVRIDVPLCLSHHPASPPDEADVLRRAAACRARLD